MANSASGQGDREGEDALGRLGPGPGVELAPARPRRRAPCWPWRSRGCRRPRRRRTGRRDSQISWTLRRPAMSSSRTAWRPSTCSPPRPLSPRLGYGSPGDRDARRCARRPCERSTPMRDWVDLVGTRRRARRPSDALTARSAGGVRRRSGPPGRRPGGGRTGRPGRSPCRPACQSACRCPARGRCPGSGRPRPAGRPVRAARWRPACRAACRRVAPPLLGSRRGLTPPPRVMTADAKQTMPSPPTERAEALGAAPLHGDRRTDRRRRAVAASRSRTRRQSSATRTPRCNRRCRSASRRPPPTPATRRSNSIESAPANAGSVSGNCWPRSARPAAPSRASATAWATTSPSLWPTRPGSPGEHARRRAPSAAAGRHRCGGRRSPARPALRAGRSPGHLRWGGPPPGSRRPPGHQPAPSRGRRAR